MIDSARIKVKGVLIPDSPGDHASWRIWNWIGIIIAPETSVNYTVIFSAGLERPAFLAL